jgi:integral membrane sensor domain MASE1
VIRYVSVTTIASLGSTLAGAACLAGDHAISWNEYWHSGIHWFLADEISLLGVAPFLIIHVLPVGAQASDVKKHAGKIWFETEPGRCTTFFLQLPF